MNKTLIIASFFTFISMIFVTNGFGETLKLTTKSGINFEADFYQAVSENSPAIIILPGMTARRSDYTSLAKRINNNGINVLSINYAKLDRVSRSAKHKDKKKVLAKRGGTIAFVKNEVQTAIQYLQTNLSVDKNRIGLVGASLGTWVGFEAMSEFNDLECLVMVSPTCGISGKGFRSYGGTKDLANAFGNRNLLLLGSEKDRHSPKYPSAVDKAEYLVSIMPNAKIEKFYLSGKLHGYYLINKDKKAVETINQWLKAVL